MSATEESLSSILSNSAPPVEKPAEATGESSAPPAEKVEKTEAKETARDESGKFTKVETKAEVEKPATPEPVKPRADVAAIIDERRKRQALEKQIAELTANKPAAKVSVFDNEDEAIRSRVDEATRPLREAHYNLSMRYARTAHGEGFAEAEASFMEAAEANPSLYEGLRNAGDPGQYIYMHGTFHKEMSEVGGDILKYREKVTTETAGKLSEVTKENASLKAQIEALTKAQAELEALPKSLNSRASGSTPKAGEGDDEDIKSIARFGNKQR